MIYDVELENFPFEIYTYITYDLNRPVVLQIQYGESSGKKNKID